jgi:hypothetical protein
MEDTTEELNRSVAVLAQVPVPVPVAQPQAAALPPEARHGR